MSKNTLLNYFTKVQTKDDKPVISVKNNVDLKIPNCKRKETYSKEDIEYAIKTPPSVKKRSRQNSLKKFNSPTLNKKEKIEEQEKEIDRNSVASIESPPHKRRKRIIEELKSEDDDSEDDYVPAKEEESDSEDLSEDSISENDCSVRTESDESPEKKKKDRNNRKPVNKSLCIDKPRVSLSVSIKENGHDADNWPHLKLPFLQPDKIKDAKRRLKSDPNYDPKTIYVPDDFKNNLTPGVRQWWELKTENFDTVLFFKVGKFYELYHMDAVIAANELNLTFMRGEFAHVGFPEIAYGRFSATLVEKGYKVARVEQTETPDMMAERCKSVSKCTKFDRVVKREICQITSRGTRVFGILDSETKDGERNFLLAIAEKEVDNVSSCYGVCFVDTSIGLFHVGQFWDDRHSSRLRTLIAHYPPVQILYEKNQVSSRTQQLFNTVLSNAIKDQLQPDIEFWSASKTLIKLIENYFTNHKFPEQLNKFIGEDVAVNMTTSENSELGTKALGAVVWCLQRSLIDYQLLTMGRFSVYKQVDEPMHDVEDSISHEIHRQHLVLDAITLKNLNVLENSSGDVHGTLLHKLDNCCTSFGKRLLQHWICMPLGNIESIKARQEAVCFLKDCSIIQDVRTALSQLPDLERLLLKIHSQGSTGIQESHPDTRAILFEEKKYSKKKIIDFITALNGFRTAQKIIRLFEKLNFNEIPSLLKQCCGFSSNFTDGSFPNLSGNLDYFDKAFDHEEAQKEGRILPTEGTISEYDEAIANLKQIEKELSQYLKEQCSYFGCNVSYYGSGKKRYQLEIRDSAVKRANYGYELQSQRKGFKRYITAETKSFLERMIAAEEQKLNVLKTLRERIFSRFSEKSADWNAAVQCLSVLDVLSSFAEYSRNENDTCVPQFIPISSTQQPFVNLVNGRYPCVTRDDVFIPNTTIVGGDAEQTYPALVLVTGPNMGGKSTLMRQFGLIIIMAHMGCHVPAAELKLSLVDRIFTRLGANDDIMAGESTFYVELCETSSILQHATKHSVVLIDELGRGTSTYDGTAIASAVLNELCRMKCRTLFSTHYHSLVEEFRNNSDVALGHMACMVENENEDDENESEETVTFLYKLTDGACPKSYGFNAARLAGMPKHITKLGQLKAKQLEIDASKRNCFKKLFQFDSLTVRELIISI